MSEELEFVAQPCLFEPRQASKLTLLLHPTSYIIKCYSFGGSDKDFETVYEQCARCCKVFLEQHS